MMGDVGKLSVKLMLTVLTNRTPDVYMWTCTIWVTSFASSCKWSGYSKQVFINPLNFRPTSIGKHNSMGHLLPLWCNCLQRHLACEGLYLRFEHVRGHIKFDDFDLRLFTAGELNIIDRPDISSIEMRGRLNLLKNIMYLAGFYEWRGILQFYATIINQIEMGMKGWVWLLGAISCLVAICTLKPQGQPPAGAGLKALVGARPKSEPSPWHCWQQGLVLLGLPAGGMQPTRPSLGLCPRQRASDGEAYLR